MGLAIWYFIVQLTRVFSNAISSNNQVPLKLLNGPFCRLISIFEGLNNLLRVVISDLKPKILILKDAVTKWFSFERISEESHQVKKEGYRSISETTSYSFSAEASTSIVRSMVAKCLIDTYSI